MSTPGAISVKRVTGPVYHQPPKLVVRVQIPHPITLTDQFRFEIGVGRQSTNPI
jgi:hypothetical protein